MENTFLLFDLRKTKEPNDADPELSRENINSEGSVDQYIFISIDLSPSFHESMLGPETNPDYGQGHEDSRHHHAHVGTLDGHDGPVLSVRFTRDGSYCLTTGKVCNGCTHLSSDCLLLCTIT